MLLVFSNQGVPCLRELILVGTNFREALALIYLTDINFREMLVQKNPEKYKLSFRIQITSSSEIITCSGHKF